ncbi:hypothetical protein CGZ77_08260 [Neisseria sp. KEM232]|nr:hypothetical protein CGZ77_08260 [Neisseria sp. KEM232]
MNKTRLKTLAACIAVLGTPAAFADNTAADAAESSALETVIVKGNKNKHQTGRDRVYTREVVNLYKGKEEVETFKGNTVSDLLSGMVGVYSGDARNSGAIDPNIRGVQGQGRIPVTVDGTEQAITVWRGYAGANNRNYVDPNIISSVYVEKGPSFNRGIKSGIGGSVAMKTIDADDIVPEGQNNAATVNDVLNAGFTVQGNGVAKDFVTHGDTVNFANGQGTVAKVESKDGVTKVSFDTPMQYVDNSGKASTDPTNTVSLVGKDSGKPVQLKNVAKGVADTDAVNVSQLKGAASALGGGSSIDKDGNFTAPSYTLVDGKPSDGKTKAYNNVGDALSALNTAATSPLTFAGDSGTNVERKLGSTVNVKGGVTDASKLSDNNIGVVANGTDGLNVKLAKELKGLTSAEFANAAGDVTAIGGNGVTITPKAAGKKPVSLTSNGLNNGGKLITASCLPTDRTISTALKISGIRQSAYCANTMESTVNLSRFS